MSTGLLITNLFQKLKPLADLVNKQLLFKLYIYVTDTKAHPQLNSTEWISKSVVDMYSSTSHLFPNTDVRIVLNELKNPDEQTIRMGDFDADVLILPENYDRNKISDLQNTTKKISFNWYTQELDSDAKNVTPSSKLMVHQNVVLGGTFDRLHNGHKILLSEALLRCSNKITVGVTDRAMTKSKKLSELIEPPQKRVEEVEAFIKKVDKSVKCEVVVISDMYGPTKSDPNLDMLVVSAETQKGGDKVNEARRENNLKELVVHVVKLVDDSVTHENEEQKISSSNQRMRLLGTYLKIPEPKPQLPRKPYLIGLTGGTASGKTSISKYLKSLGAGVIDCDELCRQLYRPKTKLYNELIGAFGNGILSENGEVSKRKLDKVVLSDPVKIQKLNELTWPAMHEAILCESVKMYEKENKEIVIVETRPLITSNWNQNFREIWASILPPNEAVARILKERNLTEEEANARVNALPSNLQIVEVSNVVFSTLWGYDFTRSQVDRAWQSLQNFIRKQ